MNLTKYEQSGFVLEANNGFRLAFDIGNKTPMERLGGIGKIDAMVISHIHGDHFSLEQIKKIAPQKLYLNHECMDALGLPAQAGEESISSEIIQVKSRDVIEMSGIKVTYFTVDHGPNISEPVENLGFLIEVDNQKIYFAGDMFYPSGMDVTNLEVDIALLPVGGHYTFGPQEALAFAKQFKKIGKIISMHYEKNNFIDPIRHEEFLELAKGIFIVE